MCDMSCFNHSTTFSLPISKTLQKICKKGSVTNQILSIINKHQILGHISPLLVFSRQNAVLPPDIEDLLPGSMDFYPSVDFSANVSTIVFSKLGTAEMNLSYIEQLYRFMNTERALIVVEIGNSYPIKSLKSLLSGDKNIQTRSLLDKGALCWGEAKLNIPSPNTAYLCNDLQVGSYSNPRSNRFIDFLGLLPSQFATG